MGTLKDAVTTQLTVHTWTGVDWLEEAVLTTQPIEESDGYTSAVAVSGDLVAATWNASAGTEDTGYTPGSRPPAEIHVWKRDAAGWTLADGSVSPRRGDALGSTLDLHGTVLIVGSLAEGDPVDPAAPEPYGAVYVFDLAALVDAEPLPVDTDTDTDTDTDPLPDPDTDAPATDGKRNDPAGCGCDSRGVGGAPWLGLIAAMGGLVARRGRGRR